MLKNGLYLLALIVLTFFVFFIGVILFGGTNNSYTDFMLTLIAVHLVSTKLNIKQKE